MSVRWSLCIDFGTAFSKAAVVPADSWRRFDASTVRPLMLSPDDGGNPFLLDSAVFVDEDRVLFGYPAIERGEALASRKRAALRSFKTLLSVSDLDRVLNTNAPPAVDPHRVFPLRDLVVLYLAYLLASVERGIAADPALAAGSFERRYAAPAWRSGDSAGLHQTVVRLFGEAEAFRREVGEDLLSPEGLSFAYINEHLPGALDAPAHLPMGLIFEATAAAACSIIGTEDAASYVMVVDMGAGTTDITAMANTKGRIQELADARVTLKEAGDHIDRIIANMIIEESHEARSMIQQTQLWRALMPRMRDIKESLFLDGRATVRGERRAITVMMRDLERNDDFKRFHKSLKEAYDHSFAVMRDYAARNKGRDVHAVAVGGGASAPFIQALLTAKQPRASNLRIEARPATPDWAHAPEFEGNLAPVFPQLAIAVGGALAPAPMLAAQANPDASGQTGTRAARD